MKKNILLSVLTVIAIAFVLQGCLNDKGLVPKPPETYCDNLNVSYNLDVKPLAILRCATNSGCHVAGGSGPGDFTTYIALSGVSESVKERILLPVSDAGHMPQFQASLPQEELDIFICWIDAGSPNN